VSETAFTKKRADKYLDQSRLIVPALPIVRQIDENDSKTYSQEFRLVSDDAPDDRWRWVVGAFAMREDVDEVAGYRLQSPPLPVAPLIPLLNALVPGLGSLFDENGQVNLLNVDVDAKVQEQALFGDLTRRLGDRWELSVGGRFYHTTSGGDLVQNGVFEIASTSGSLQKNIDGEIKETGFNPKASLLWHASDDALFYTAASRGFRVGGVQPGFTSSLSAKQAPDFFKSDSLWNYEAGTRTQWLMLSTLGRIFELEGSSASPVFSDRPLSAESCHRRSVFSARDPSPSGRPEEMTRRRQRPSGIHAAEVSRLIRAAGAAPARDLRIGA
jgi:outer membrane receptor protein involved in Fe transport